MKVSERGQNGLFKATKQAKILRSDNIDLDLHKSLLIVPNSDYMKGMAENINYFDKVLTMEEFEKEIILAEKQDEVGALTGNIGLNNAYRKYKPFLYLKFDNSTEGKKKIQLKLINPDTLEDILITETAFDYIWAGVYDANTFNPLFNQVVRYIQSNSTTYR